MDRDFYTNDFETFLKNKADQHRLYPSERVWKRIYSSLHPSKGRMIVAVMLLLCLFTSDQIILLQTSQNELSGSLVANKSVLADNFLKQMKEGLKLSQSKATAYIFNQPSYLPSPKAYKWFFDRQSLPKEIAAKLPPTAGFKTTLDNAATAGSESNNLANNDLIVSAFAKPFVPVKASADYDDQHLAYKFSNVALADNATKPLVVAKPIAIAEKKNSLVIKNEFQQVKASSMTAKQKTKNPLQIQYYIAPTISFRKLEEQSKPTTSQNLPLASNHLDINRFVNHSPAIGLEAGSAILFPINKNISLKAGLQLNISGYNISAFTYRREKATIALNTAGPIGDTIATFTSIRNMSGYTEEILKNKYYEISVPIGVDIKVIGDKRLQLNVAGTIQPFYVMAHSTYLLSNDYNNYVKEHSLVRRWNYAASLETYLSYTSGNGWKWQMGPQFRYQLKSTYTDRYPIHEYLMEYSLKLGVIKTLK